MYLRHHILRVIPSPLTLDLTTTVTSCYFFSSYFPPLNFGLQHTLSFLCFGYIATIGNVLLILATIFQIFQTSPDKELHSQMQYRFINIEPWIMVGEMSPYFLISRSQEEKNTRYSGSKLRKVLTCHTSVWNYPVFTYNLNCSLFHMVSHFFIIDQRNILPNPFYFTFASMSLCHILGKSLQ